MQALAVTILAAFLLVATSASADTPPQAKGARAETPPDMESHTLILLERGPKATAFSEAELEKLQAQHLAHLDKLGRAGKILLAGPFSDQTHDALRGGCIYSVPLAEAVALAEQDPMVKAGRLKITAMTWWVGKGYVAFPKAPQKP